mmetsp:Transcript_149549/g.461694  ORF Transcript_149549/g.461694 Transcript_149549/m.461694 type:complete len:282 (-) Transcript_149549:3-848(-)
MPAGCARTAEDEEFEEADSVLAELQRRAGTGEGDLPWGYRAERSWGEDGVLRLTREYAVARGAGVGEDGVLRLRLREFPYSAHPRSGVCGTGGVVWAGALALSSLLQERRGELLSGGCRRVVEIGAGCGLVGLVAASLAGEGARVVLTDESEAVLANLRHNVLANAGCFAAQVDVARLAWEEVLDGRARPPVDAADLLLGSDVIWGDRGPLVGRLALRLLRPGGRLAICAQRGREGLDAFEGILASPSGPQGLPAFEVARSPATAAGGEALIHYLCRRAAG